MTETSSLTATHHFTNSYAVASLHASVSPLPTGQVSPHDIPEEEEYTIKCICKYRDDDGNTVFCEKCESWQHIACYYGDSKVPEVHLCQDCDPRVVVNVDQAQERQKKIRELISNGGDRKPKKPSTKGTKKKHRDLPNGDQPLGWTNHERQESLTQIRDLPPPTKRHKSSHRASTSVVSLNGESRKRALSNAQHNYPSPSKSPQEQYRWSPIPRYSQNFLELYDKDDGDVSATENEHTIQGIAAVTSWKTDPSLVAPDLGTAALQHQPFIKAGDDWGKHAWPPVTVETTQPAAIDKDDPQPPTWKGVKLQSAVPAGKIVGEICGQVGTFDEYCHQKTSDNHWLDMLHPDPFVFFHPAMEIYIDSRRSGTQFRYVRRSCDPNVALKSFIAPDEVVHHCFVACRDLPAGTELTAPWYLELRLFDQSREATVQIQQERREKISWTLANFGDCACAGTKCLLATHDIRTRPSPQESAAKASTGKKKRIKTKHTISPLSTGHATNSRAGSETVKAPDEDEDHHSTSGSSRGGLRSRDLTPQGGLLDANPVLGNGLTAREMRKIQAMEKKEQSVRGDKKPKKRTSGGSALNTPNASTSKRLDLFSMSTDTQRSGSPQGLLVTGLTDDKWSSTKSTGPVTVKREYMDAGCQTDPEWTDQITLQLKQRKYLTPTQRLAQRIIHDRAKSWLAYQATLTPAHSNGVQDDGPATKEAATSPPISLLGTRSTSTAEEGLNAPSVDVPLPSRAAHTVRMHSSQQRVQMSRPHLSTLPPVPVFPSWSETTVSESAGEEKMSMTPIRSDSPGGLAPLPTSVSLVPDSSLISPSPAKKKLSLGDYMSRRKESATPTVERLGPDFDKQDDVTMKDATDTRPAGSEEHAGAPETSEVGRERGVEDVSMPDPDQISYGDSNPASTGNTPQHSPDLNAAVEATNFLASLSGLQAHDDGSDS